MPAEIWQGHWPITHDILGCWSWDDRKTIILFAWTVSSAIEAWGIPNVRSPSDGSSVPDMTSQRHVESNCVRVHNPRRQIVGSKWPPGRTLALQAVACGMNLEMMILHEESWTPSATLAVVRLRCFPVSPIFPSEERGMANRHLVLARSCSTVPTKW